MFCGKTDPVDVVASKFTVADVMSLENRLVLELCLKIQVMSRGIESFWRATHANERLQLGY